LKSFENEKPLPQFTFYIAVISPNGLADGQNMSRMLINECKGIYCVVLVG